MRSRIAATGHYSLTARRPKLGQHFLVSDTYRHRVAEAAGIRPDDLVLEIGPGRGAMTGLLIDRARSVVAVEVDASLVDKLKQRYEESGRFEIITSDILELNLEEICERHHTDRLFAFGNLPYYITSPILRHILDSASRVRAMAFVVQREVAERISSVPGSRDYGYLSVLAQAYSRPHIAFTIPPGAFAPPPAVHSALLTFDMRDASPPKSEDRRRRFLDFVKLGFVQKRKKLANNLARAYPLTAARYALHACGLAENVRAEELSVEQLARVFNQLNPDANP